MERARKGLGLLLAVALVGLAAPITAVAEETSGDTLFGSFGGNAFGSYANATAGNVATKLGRSAYITSGCDGTGGKVRSNTVDTVKAGKTAKAEQIYNTAYTKKTSSDGVARHTSKVEGVRLLRGRISADAVKAVARTRADKDRAWSNTRGSKFVNLTVDGTPVASRPAKNERMKLPGIGHIVLKSVKRSGNGVYKSAIKVNMITIVVKESNRFDLPVGAKIVVAHAASRFKRQEPVAVVDGAGFAALAKSDAAKVENKVGRAAAIYLPCHGTNGKVLSNTVHSLMVHGQDNSVVLSSETGKSTTTGDLTTDVGTLALTTSKVRNVSLFDGMITAQKVRTVAKAVFAATGEASSEGTYLDQLRVAGVPIPTSIPPNTRVDLPGIGYVIVKEEKLVSTATLASARVIGLHVFINTANSYGLPVGTEIIVSSAWAVARPFN
jgi:hypothetical protein